MQLNHGRGQRNFKGNGEFLRLIKKKIEKKKQQDIATLGRYAAARMIKYLLDKVLSRSNGRTNASLVRVAGFPLIPAIQCVSRLSLYL